MRYSIKKSTVRIWGLLALLPLVMWGCSFLIKTVSVQQEAEDGTLVSYVKAGEMATFQFSGTISIDGDASNETFIVAFLVPRSWNARQTAEVTYYEDRYEPDIEHSMHLIADTEQPANYKGMTWGTALKKKYGVRNNVLNDMEWVTFKSESYAVVNGTINYSVTIRCKSGKNNLKFKPSFFINHSNDGIGSDNAHYAVADSKDCFEVVKGEGSLIDFCSMHYYQIEPLAALQDDFVTFTFQGDIHPNELANEGDVYFEATAYTSTGKSYRIDEKSEKTLMKRDAVLPRYALTLWPGGFFGISEAEVISRIDYVFTDRTGNIIISKSDDDRDNAGEEIEEDAKSPFSFELRCE